MPRFFVFILVGTVPTGVFSLWAETPLQKPDGLPEVLWDKLVELDRKAADIGDLTAAFQQHKFTPVLKKPLVSEGFLWVRGDRMLWRTEKPRRGVMFLSGGDLHLLYPDEKRMEIYPLKDAMASALAGPMPRLKQLVEGFRIEAAEAPPLIREPVPLKIEPGHVLAVAMFPLHKKLAERVSRIDVLIDARTGVLRRMSRTDAQGQRTVITLGDIRLNTDFEPRLLDPEIPAGTRVSRPLEALSP